MKKCQDSQCKFCESLLLSKEYTFKNAVKTFTLKIKTLASCNSFGAIDVAICSGCLEQYIGETGVDKTRLRDRIRVYRQPVKVEEHIQICERAFFNIFLFLHMQSNDTNLKTKASTIKTWGTYTNLWKRLI